MSLWLTLPLVPKLHLGTHLLAKFNLAFIVVPKYNLGTSSSYAGGKL
jgi:hypothetical protein